jgi:hypothetical protein
MFQQNEARKGKGNKRLKKKMRTAATLNKISLLENRSKPGSHENRYNSAI